MVDYATDYPNRTGKVLARVSYEELKRGEVIMQGKKVEVGSHVLLRHGARDRQPAGRRDPPRATSCCPGLRCPAARQAVQGAGRRKRRMITKRLLLFFPKSETEKPIVYHLVKDYDLVINIFRAKVTPEEFGYLVLDVSGSDENIARGSGLRAEPRRAGRRGAEGRALGPGKVHDVHQLHPALPDQGPAHPRPLDHGDGLRQPAVRGVPELPGQLPLRGLFVDLLVRQAMSAQTGFPVRPRLGVLFFTSGWFREVGLQDPASDTTAQVEAAARRAVSDLGEYCEPVFTRVLFSAEEARTEARRLAAAEVDGLLASPLMWCEDQVVRAALAELPGLPLVLWTFSPEASLPEFLPFQRMLRGSGAVCTLQLSGMLQRERRWLRSVAGPLGDPEVYRAIGSWARAAAVARRLRSLRVGVLPFRCDQMSTTYVDEFELRRLYGIELAYLELERVRRAAGEAAASEVAGFRRDLEAAGTRVEVDDRNLEEGIRYALALEKVLAQEKLPALAMNDVIPEMHSSFGLRPCLSNPRLSERAVVAMEADVAAAMAMQALRLATGERPFYTETFSADYEAAGLLLGHAGYHDAANADPAQPVQVVPDVEYENSDRFSGAATLFKYRPGPVTLVNSVWDGERLKWVALEGRSQEGPPRMDGNCHLFCSLEVPVREFFRRSVESGVSQHWIVVHGHRLAEVEFLCDTAGIRLLALR